MNGCMCVHVCVCVYIYEELGTCIVLYVCAYESMDAYGSSDSKQVENLRHCENEFVHENI
jgi:hypothetical protein